MAVTFGPYRLLRRIAAGGMGEVYLSVLERGDFRKPLALKRILPSWCERPEFAERFAAEAALSAMLNHANIVQIFDYGCIDGASYLAMELVEGPDLAGLLASCGRLEPELAAEIALQLCRALGHAHERRDSAGRPCGIVHGDVSPSNILLTVEGQVKLADFGIARLLGTSSAAGVVCGKLCYLSPEQARGEAPTPRSDLFSLGLVLLEMLGGQKPRPEYSVDEMLAAAARAEHLALEQLPSGLPKEWHELLEQLLAPEPAERMNSAAAAACFISAKLSPCGPDRLGAFVSKHASSTLENLSSPPEPTEAAGIPVDTSRRASSRWLFFLLAAAAAAALGTIYYFAGRPENAEPAGAMLGTGPFRAEGSTQPTPPLANPPDEKIEPKTEPDPKPPPKVARAKPDLVRLRPSPGEKTPFPPPSPPPPPAVEINLAGPWQAELDHMAIDSRQLRLEWGVPHLIEIKHQEKNARVSLRLTPGARSHWRMALSAEPWMNIQLDGRPLGQTPRLQVALAAGEHRLVLSRSEHGLELPLSLSLPP